MNPRPRERRPHLDIRFGAVGLSLLLSLWLLFSNDKINPDGPLYLDTAARLLAGDWLGAYQLYHWPFFSAFVAAVSLATGWSLETSALALNAGLAALLVHAFLTLSQDLGADRKTLMFAAFVVLSFPYLNENRPEVIRDIGFWAFYTVGAGRFVRFVRRPAWGNALAWSLTTLLAALFRPEGLIVLLLLPCVLWFQGDWTPRQRWRGFLTSQALAGMLAAIGLLAVLARPELAHFSGRLFEPVQRLQDFWLAASSGVRQKADLLRTLVLEPTGGSYAHYAGKSAMTMIWGGLIAVVVVKLFTLLTPLYALLPLVGRFRRRLPLPADGARVLLALGLINGGIILVFVVSTFYLSSRFLMPLALTILPVMPFLLASAHDVWQRRANEPAAYRWALPVLGIALVALAADGLFTTAPDKRYLKQAGAWLREHSDPAARVYTNEALIHYYSGHGITWDARENYQLPPPEPLEHYDYAAIEVKRGNLPAYWRDIVEQGRMKPVQGFENRRADGVRISRITGSRGADGQAAATRGTIPTVEGD